jgi:hypothetical protein|uniref:hypothetical protein n=1 Tax=Eubacterium cellulosolvens TaxID=29322 RepID=UPI00048158F2|nr:hypothetical protein [[Eubacterium] cellulosolvens]
MRTIKKEMGNIFRRFVYICGFALIITVITGPVFQIIDGLNNTQIAFIAVCSVAAALSSLVFLSSKELHGAAWWGRELLCVLINMAVTLPLTHHAGLWHTTNGMMLVTLLIIVIAFGNHLIEFLFDMKTASQLNRKIRNLR